MLMHTNMAGHVGYVGLAYNAPYPLNTTRCCLWPGRPPRLRLMRPPRGGWGGAASTPYGASAKKFERCPQEGVPSLWVGTQFAMLSGVRYRGWGWKRGRPEPPVGGPSRLRVYWGGQRERVSAFELGDRSWDGGHKPPPLVLVGSCVSPQT